MANSKQFGSNGLNAEYSKGYCRTRCENCYVNFGDRGPQSRQVFASAKQTDFSIKVGRRDKTYTPPRKLTKEELAAIGPGERPLTRVIAGGDQGDENALDTLMNPKGMYDIPYVGGQDPNLIDKYKAHCAKHGVIEGREDEGLYPFFMRVSTVSDSCRAALSWLKKLRMTWGDYCFFNSSIRSMAWAARERPEVLEVFHKLVVTTNPGFQNIRPVRPATSYVSDAEERKRLRAEWAVKLVEGDVPWMSMGPAKDKAMDFYNPKTLTEIGLGHMEKTIKFYRLRAVPSIMPRLETDRPVVITQLRFKGIQGGIEFARRYGVEAKVLCGTGFYHVDGVTPSAGAEREFRHWWDRAKFVPDMSIKGRRLLLRSRPSGDDRNTSKHAGKWSLYAPIRNWYRPVSTAYLDNEDWVCDRSTGSCANCGLCCSLDGTQRDNINRLNVNPDGEVLAPIPGPEGAFYLGAGLQGTDYFDAVLRAHGVGLAEILAGDPFDVDFSEGFRLNPEGVEPMHPDNAMEALNEVSLYLKADDIDPFAEGWNTHEDVSATAALSCWSLVAWAYSKGMTKAEARKKFYMTLDAVDEGTGLYDAVPSFEDLWTGYADCCGEFGMPWEV